jgi:flagellar biosynthesis protein FliR
MSGAVNLFGLTQAQFETFVLVLVRVSVILLMIPIFQSAEVNVRVRFGSRSSFGTSCRRSRR